MASVVVPFRAGGKRRLAPLPDDVRSALAVAMLADVLAACAAVGDVRLVTADEAAEAVARELDVQRVADPGGGQGAAVLRALAGEHGPVLVVNADLPCATPADLLALLAAMPPRGVALAPARDGTTNALALADPSLFAPLYGPGSAVRFRDHAAAGGADARCVDLPNLADDVDTVADLERVEARAGPRTRAALRSAQAGVRG